MYYCIKVRKQGGTTYYTLVNMYNSLDVLKLDEHDLKIYIITGMIAVSNMFLGDDGSLQVEKVLV